MSNYLHRIAAKSLILTPGVRPRIAARFEPSTGSRSLTHGVWDAGVDASTEAALETNTVNQHLNSLTENRALPDHVNKQISPGSSHPAPTVDNSTSIHPPSNAASPLRQPRSEIGLTTNTTPPIDPEPSFPPRSHSSHQNPSYVGSPVPKRSTTSEPQTSDLSVGDVLTPHTSASTQASVQSQMVRPLSPSPLSALTPAPLPQAAEPRLDHHTLTSRSPNFIEPSLQPFTKSSSTQPASTSQSPTIQVTIGRVEVRAIAPKPPQSKPVKSRPQTPSLENYLQARNRLRRNGGS